MAVTRWTIYDPVDGDEYEFEINPNAGGSPSYRKTMTFESTTAGRTVMFEGADEIQQLEWSGVILTQNHYEKYVEWWSKRRQVMLTDDLGRQYWIYIREFTPTRVRSFQHPWKHDYNVIAVILDW